MDGTGLIAAAKSAETADREGREVVAPLAGCLCPREPPSESKKKKIILLISVFSQTEDFRLSCLHRACQGKGIYSIFYISCPVLQF